MSLAPSTYYHRPKGRSPEAVAAEARLVARIHAICAEFPRYGYRRVTAQLKAEGRRVNHKRVSRIMGEQDLRVRPRRRFVVTTDSDHDGPIFPDLAKAHGVALYPFFLDGVAMVTALNQPDGIHPNARGVEEVVRRILPAVEALLARVSAAATAPPQAG